MADVERDLMMKTGAPLPKDVTEAVEKMGRMLGCHVAGALSDAYRAFVAARDETLREETRQHFDDLISRITTEPERCALGRMPYSVGACTGIMIAYNVRPLACGDLLRTRTGRTYGVVGLGVMRERAGVFSARQSFVAMVLHDQVSGRSAPEFDGHEEWPEPINVRWWDRTQSARNFGARIDYASRTA